MSRTADRADAIDAIDRALDALAIALWVLSCTGTTPVPSDLERAVHARAAARRDLGHVAAYLKEADYWADTALDLLHEPWCELHPLHDGPCHDETA